MREACARDLSTDRSLGNWRRHDGDQGGPQRQSLACSTPTTTKEDWAPSGIQMHSQSLPHVDGSP